MNICNRERGDRENLTNPNQIRIPANDQFDNILSLPDLFLSGKRLLPPLLRGFSGFWVSPAGLSALITF